MSRLGEIWCESGQTWPEHGLFRVRLAQVWQTAGHIRPDLVERGDFQAVCKGNIRATFGLLELLRNSRPLKGVTLLRPQTQE